MGIRVERFPEYGVELHIRSGVISGPEQIRHFQSLGPADALRWIHYYSPTAEPGATDIASLPELRRAVAAKKKELFGDDPPPSLVVYGGEGDGAVFEFWRRFADHGGAQSAPPLMFPTLGAACDWLRLPEAARAALVRAVEA